MKYYEKHDIIMSDDQTSCSQITDNQDPYGYGLFTHDATVVGYGRSGVIEYWLVKQSWGESFGHGGYQKLQRTFNKKTSVFCIEDFFL